MSPTGSVRAFFARLESSGNTLHWTIVKIPFDSAAVWGSRGQIHVKRDIHGFEFRTVLFPTGAGGHYMVVNKKMQGGGRVSPGMEAAFRLEPDNTATAIHVPAELAAAMKSSRRLQKFFQSFSPKRPAAAAPV